MRIAVLSDVHASIEALDAVLNAARAEADRVVLLGDLVGYHADPDACVARVRALGLLSIAGDQDRAAAGLLGTGAFGEAGRRAMVWTRRTMTRENADFLASLPTTETLGEDILLFHGAIHPEPDVERPLTTPSRARRSLEALRDGSSGLRVGFFGHTHRPIIHRLTAGGRLETLPPQRLRLDTESHWLINPGSVGQSRDADARASYAIYDEQSREIRFERVDYDFTTTRRKAARAGLLWEPPATTRALGRITDWIDDGISAVKGRFA